MQKNKIIMILIILLIIFAGYFTYFLLIKDKTSGNMSSFDSEYYPQNNSVAENGLQLTIFFNSEQEVSLGNSVSVKVLIFNNNLENVEVTYYLSNYIAARGYSSKETKIELKPKESYSANVNFPIYAPYYSLGPGTGFVVLSNGAKKFSAPFNFTVVK